jgi:hypothetical protein
MDLENCTGSIARLTSTTKVKPGQTHHSVGFGTGQPVTVMNFATFPHFARLNEGFAIREHTSDLTFIYHASKPVARRF